MIRVFPDLFAQLLNAAEVNGFRFHRILFGSVFAHAHACGMTKMCRL